MMANETENHMFYKVFGKQEKPKPKKRKRARKKDGTFRGDDKSTPNVNEAWENE